MLDWDDFHWCGHVGDVPGLGSDVEIHVETENEEKVDPHSLQTQTWNSLQQNALAIGSVIQSGLFDYYCRIRPQYEQSGPEWVANMPVLERSEDIGALITLNYIKIGWPYDDEEPRVGFSFGCDWDREHGAGIVIRGNEVLKTGGADCLYAS